MYFEMLPCKAYELLRENLIGDHSHQLTANVTIYKGKSRNLEKPLRFFTQHIYRTPKGFLENPERFFITEKPYWFSVKPLGRVFHPKPWLSRKPLRVFRAL
jgi:hypothetical protein